MNVLITVNSYYPLSDGVQSVTEYLAEGIVRDGYEVTVITASHGIKEKEVIHNGVRVIRVDVSVKHAVYYGEKCTYISLVKKYCKQVDVMVNVCTQNPMTDLLLPELKKIKCKKILYMHGMYDFRWFPKDIKSVNSLAHKVWNDLRWNLLYTLRKDAFIQYDRIIQIHHSEYGVQYMKKKYGIDCEILENAADNMFFDASFTKRISELPQKYFIYVANYFQPKNHEFVMKAFYNLNLKNYSLVLIGNKKTDYYNKLLRIKDHLEQEFGHRDVRLLVGIDRNKIPAYVANAELYLMGSEVEKYPVSIIEAMACGTPFISTDVGCVKYLPGGVIIKNEEEMSNKIVQLLEDGTIEKIRKEGKEYAQKNLRIEVKVKQFEHILENLCKR